MRIIGRALLALSALAVLAMVVVVAPATADAQGRSTSQITFTNLTDSQPMTAPVVAIHDEAVQLFYPGTEASRPLQHFVENGNDGPLVDFAFSAPASVVSAAGVAVPLTGGLLMPGESATITLSTDRSDHVFSFVSTIVCSNDAFTGMSLVPLPYAGTKATVEVLPYDAGTELNVLDPDYWVPYCGSRDGKNLRIDEDALVAPHKGQTGVGWADFTSGAAMIEVTIEPTTGSSIPVPVNDIAAPELAFTGTTSQVLTAAAMALFTLGGSLVIVARRRSSVD